MWNNSEFGLPLSVFLMLEAQTAIPLLHTMAARSLRKLEFLVTLPLWSGRSIYSFISSMPKHKFLPVTRCWCTVAARTQEGYQCWLQAELSAAAPFG